ncbi:P-loop containing nucleoside triphosphate hydrolase protein [Panaeolus papilionaceus]|nr:P-loop containing nucleoside triphosphate hydrolase protein [Panaeolus papilionaceus]
MAQPYFFRILTLTIITIRDIMEGPKNIDVTGEISLQPYAFVSGIDPFTGPGHYVVLIVGPTGAGKSSFVESLAGPSQMLSLSSGQLAGYTQQIGAFRVVNANMRRGPLYVVDTPGFSDSKLSEKEILDMVNTWVTQNGLSYVHGTLYLVPINVTRLPGTKRKTMEMLTTFLKSSYHARGKGIKYLTFVTTMWDTLYGEQALSRGQSNFEELRDKQLKYYIDGGAQITKFTNTRLSALQILDAVLVSGDTIRLTDLDPRTPPIYRDLHERIESALLLRKNIEDDLAQPDAQTNQDLRDILEGNFQENDEVLAKFIEQFLDYGDPPEGFEDVAQGLRHKIIADTNLPLRMRLMMLESESQQASPSLLPETELVSTSEISASKHRSLRSAFRDVPRRIREEAKGLGLKLVRPKR